MSDHDEHDLPPVDPRIAGAAHEGCAESRLLMSRRSMLGVTAALFSSAFLPDFSHAASNANARLLVVVLRGGMDGMGMVIPKLDPLYESVRQSLAIPFASTRTLGTDFGLHPALAQVHTMFQAGDVAIAPASAIPLRNRSHFECQDNLENGLPVNTPDATGWLNRFFGSLPAGDPIRVKRGIEIGEAPLILRGPEPVLGWSPTWFDKSNPATLARLETVYTALDPELGDSLARGIASDELALASGAGGGDVSVLRKGFIGAARLMRAATGPRVAVLSVGGWDTHSDEGGVTGQFADRLSELDQGLADFKREIGTEWANTAVICVTEFGRTVVTNGSVGTDHGIATVALLVGGAIRRHFIGDWPGLAPAQLFDGDLRPTVDLRAIFKGLLKDHFGMPLTTINSFVFPDSAAITPSPSLVKNPTASSTSGKSKRPATMQEISPIGRYRQQYGV
ncbi:MAG: DUF1501 domain-containing protein [Aestuariivirga sp.]